MLPTHEFEAGSKKFKITALGSRKGQETLIKVAQLLGPAIGDLSAGMTAEGDAPPAAYGRAIATLFAKITPDAFDSLVATFMEVTEIEQEHGWVRVPKLPALVKDELWAGDYGSLLAVLREHITLNFASFLAGVGGIVRPG